VTLIAEKEAGGKGKWSRPKAQVLKEIGEHPDGGKIEVLSGRYGPYVKHGSVNATLPKGKDPASLSMEEAIGLLAARAAKSGASPKRGKAPSKKAQSKSAEAQSGETSPKKGSTPAKKVAASAKKPAAKKSPAKPRAKVRVPEPAAE